MSELENRLHNSYLWHNKPKEYGEWCYQQGKAYALEPIKAIIEESEKMMWHSSKTLENIKEKLKEQKNE